MITLKSKIILVIILTAILSIFMSGCATEASIGRHNSRHQQPINQVGFLDRELSARIAVDDIGSRRTASNTLEIWAKLRNMSSRKDYHLAIRTHFYDETGVEIEMTEWQLFYLTKHAIQTYVTQSINRDVDSYYIEVMEVEKSQSLPKPSKRKTPEKKRPLAKTKESVKDESAFAQGEFSFGMGYGWSYAGIGVKMQYAAVVGGAKMAFHIGGGYIPEGRGWFVANEGVKIYLIKNLYFDALFGFFDAYEETDSLGTVIDEGRIYGPSFLLGYDLYFSQNFGINLGAGIAYDMNYKDEIIYAFDSGLILRF